MEGARILAEFSAQEEVAATQTSRQLKLWKSGCKWVDIIIIIINIIIIRVGRVGKVGRVG